MDKVRTLFKNTKLETIGYSQSANSLFHFMKEFNYLKDALSMKALVPRYCIEDFSFLNPQYSRVAILMKCFCDIPLHMLTKTFESKIVNKEILSVHLDDIEIRLLEQQKTHSDFYGKYAIAFSKDWCEIENLNPISYINTNSSYVRTFKKSFDSAMSVDGLSDSISHFFLESLALSKPLRGEIERDFILKEEKTRLNFTKNFYDECEWRYIVPIENTISSLNPIDPIIINSNVLNSYLDENKRVLDELSTQLLSRNHEDKWLKFSYSDIKYLIVPDSIGKDMLIEHLLSLSDATLCDSSARFPKENLISKILVLDEIEEDS